MVTTPGFAIYENIRTNWRSLSSKSFSAPFLYCGYCLGLALGDEKLNTTFTAMTCGVGRRRENHPISTRRTKNNQSSTVAPHLPPSLSIKEEGFLLPE